MHKFEFNCLFATDLNSSVLHLIILHLEFIHSLIKHAISYLETIGPSFVRL